MSKYTYEKCKEEALKYNHKVDFIKNSNCLYMVAIKNKWIDDICKHMTRPPQKLKSSTDFYKVDHNQFINITNSYTAYILGLIWADGSLGKDNRTILIHCKYDSEINSDFNTIKKIINNTGCWNNYNYIRYDKRTKKEYHTAYFMTSNRYLVEYLKCVDFNIKSYISPGKIINQIPDEYIKDFIRGYFDGDGNFYINGNTLQCSCSSTIEQDWTFMIDIFNKLNIKRYKINKNISKNNHKSSSIRITNKKEIIIFGDWLYESSDNIRFERKYIKFLNIKNSNIIPINDIRTDYNINFIKNNYKNLGAKKCAEILNISLSSVKNIAIDEHLYVKVIKGKNKCWNSADIDFLLNNYKVLGAKKCAEILSRNVNNITHKYYTHDKNKKRKSCNRWTSEEILFIEENYKKLGSKLCSDKINKSIDSIRSKFYLLNKNNKKNLAQN